MSAEQQILDYLAQPIQTREDFALMGKPIVFVEKLLDISPCESVEFRPLVPRVNIQINP